MVQFFETGPSFASELSQALSQGIQGITKNKDLQRTQQTFQQLADPNLSPIQKLGIFAQLPEEHKKYTSQAIASILGPQAQSQAELSQLQQFLGGNQQQNQFQQPQQNQPQMQFPSQGDQMGMPQQQMQQPEMIQQQQAPRSFQNSVRDLSDEEVDVLSSIKGPLGKLAETERGNRAKVKEKQQSSIEAINKKREGERERIRSSRSSLTRGLQAVQSGDVGGFDINYLASLLGPAGEPLKTASGAQLDSTMKNLLIDSISDVTGRPNQWIEQQVKGATPSVGKTKEANETIFNTYLTDLDIEERKLDIEDKLMQDFTSRGRPIPSNFENLVSKELKPYAELQEDKLAYKLREIQEREKGPRFLKSYEKVPQGTPLTRERGMAFLKIAGGDKARAAALAKKAGYTIYSNELMQEIGR